MISTFQISQFSKLADIFAYFKRPIPHIHLSTIIQCRRGKYLQFESILPGHSLAKMNETYRNFGIKKSAFVFPTKI